jgi:glutaredoxin
VTAAAVIVTLYAREGCHLCDEARVVMAPIVERLGASLRDVDIDDDEELRAEYNESVPVIFVGEEFFARYRVDGAAFEKAIVKAGGKN